MKFQKDYENTTLNTENTTVDTETELNTELKTELNIELKTELKTENTENTELNDKIVKLELENKRLVEENLELKSKLEKIYSLEMLIKLKDNIQNKKNELMTSFNSNTDNNEININNKIIIETEMPELVLETVQHKILNKKKVNPFARRF